MEELNNGQYQLVNIDNDDLKRMYPNYEFVINESSVQYGQQQVIQVQTPDQVSGPVAHQQLQQVQLYQPQESQPQYVQVQSDDGVVQQHQIVYHQVGPGMQQQQQQQQQEETVSEPQYILELQTPQEQQAAAYKQQIHLQQQQVQVQQSPNQPTAQMPNQQVILHSPQQILVHQQPNTPQQTQHYYVAQPSQYFIPQQQQQPQEPVQQVQTRIVTYQSPTQNFQIQQPHQRIVFQQRQPTLLQNPQVRPQQIVQQPQQQQVTPSGLRIVARPQMPVQRLPIQASIQPIQTQRVARPRQPRTQNPRQPRANNQNPGLQQPSPVLGQSKVMYRMATQQQQRANSPQQVQQKGTVLQRVGNVQIKIPPGQRFVVQSPAQSPQIKYMQMQQPQIQQQTPGMQVQVPVAAAQQQQQQVQTTKPVDDMDDIESSITAVIVKKQCVDAAEEEQRTAMKRAAQEMIGHGGKKPITGPKTAIRSASSISSRSSDESVDRESAKMLVILKSGEQRLITFTLPRETCTVQELLEQVGVPFEVDSNIRCISNPGADIDYVVTVGISTEDSNEMIASAESSLKAPPQQPQLSKVVQPIQPGQLIVQGQPGIKPPLQAGQVQPGKKAVTSETSKRDDHQPKFINGYLAICNYCGACSNDHSRCQRCRRIFKDDIKIIPVNTTNRQQRQETQTAATTAPKGLAPEIVKRPVTQQLQKIQVKTNATSGSRGGRGGANTASRGRGRAKVEEPVILTLSSDDEDNSITSSTSNGNNLTKNGSISGISDQSSLQPLKCEPAIAENTIPSGKFFKYFINFYLKTCCKILNNFLINYLILKEKIKNDL